jgi:tetratricopeptide (TPR) repeat protein
MKYSFLISLFFILNFSLSTTAQKIPITSNSIDAITYFNTAIELENLFELDQAEDLYNQALSLDSTFAIAHLRLGMLRDNYDFRKVKLKEALKHIDRVSEGEKLLIRARVDFYSDGYDGSKEFEYTKSLVEMYPNDELANYLFGLVNLHHGRNNPNISIEYFEKALDIKSNYLKAQYELTNAYIAIKDYEKAKEIAKKSIDLLPGSVEPLNTYAEIFMRSGNYEESIVQYEKVLEMDNSFPWALMGITANLNFLDKHKEGREYLKRLRGSTLSDYEYRHKWRAKVVSFLDEGDIENAINTLEQQKQESISGKNKREPVFHIYFSHLRKTRLYFENKDFVNGFKQYSEWNKYVDKNIKSEATKTRIKNLGKYYEAYTEYIKGNNTIAINLLSKFSGEKATDNVKVLLGKIYIAEKKYQAAINKISETDLSNPYNQYWLMLSYKGNNNLLEAKKWKNKVIQLNDRNNIDLAIVRIKSVNQQF